MGNELLKYVLIPFKIYEQETKFKSSVSTVSVFVVKSAQYSVAQLAEFHWTLKF